MCPSPPSPWSANHFREFLLSSPQMKPGGTVRAPQRNSAARLTSSPAESPEPVEWVERPPCAPFCSKISPLPKTSLPPHPKIPLTHLQDRRTSILLRPVRSPAQSTGLQPCVPGQANKAACKVARELPIFIPFGIAHQRGMESCSKIPTPTPVFKNPTQIQTNSAHFRPKFFQIVQIATLPPLSQPHPMCTKMTHPTP